MSEWVQGYLELNDWQGFRNHVDRQTKLSKIEGSIRLLLNASSSSSSSSSTGKAYPPNSLQQLFDKRRELMLKSIAAGRKSKYKFRQKFKNQIQGDVCCGWVGTNGSLTPRAVEGENDFASSWGWSREWEHHLGKLRAPIIGVIMKEHSTLFDQVHGPANIDMSSKNIEKFISVMWRGYMLPYSYSGPVPKRVQDSLLSITCAKDLQLESNVDLCTLWEATEQILNHTKPTEMPLLHYCVQEEYYPIIVWLISMIHPEQLKGRDGIEGCIPLHYAYKRAWITEKLPDEFFRRTGMDSYNSEKVASYVQLLLHRFPDGARYANAHGKLPLMLYLEHGFRFSSMSNKTYLPQQDDIQCLIDASPQVLTTPDISTRLLPFMIPTIGKFDPYGNDHDGANYAISVSYDLLRRYPSVIAMVALNVKSSDTISTSDTPEDERKMPGRKAHTTVGDDDKKSDTVNLQQKLMDLHDENRKQKEEIEKQQNLIYKLLNQVLSLGGSLDDDDDDVAGGSQRDDNGLSENESKGRKKEDTTIDGLNDQEQREETKILDRARPGSSIKSFGNKDNRLDSNPGLFCRVQKRVAKGIVKATSWAGSAQRHHNKRHNNRISPHL